MAGLEQNPEKADTNGPTFTAPPPNFDPDALVAGLQARISRNTQAVNTPLNEAGIALEPPTPNERRISGRIQRAWSALWGFDGSALRLVRVDESGRLISIPDSAEKYTTTEWNDILGDENYVTQDLGSDHHRFRCITYCTAMRMEFSADGSNWFGACFWYAAGPSRTVYARARYVRLRDVLGVSNASFWLEADRLI